MARAVVMGSGAAHVVYESKGGRLLLGDIRAASDPSLTFVLAVDCRSPDQIAREPPLTDLGARRINLPVGAWRHEAEIKGQRALKSEYAAVSRKIDEVFEARGSCLMHCRAGKHRAAAAATAYLMHRGISMEKAIGLIGVREGADPMRGTLGRLLRLLS